MKRLLKNTVTKKCSVCIIKNACGSFVILNRNRGPDPFWVAESDFESEMILFTLEEEEKKWWFYFSRDQNIETEFLSLSGISNPSVRCGFVILQARFIPPLWFHGNTEFHQKNTSLFYIRTIESFFEVTHMNWEGFNLHELDGNNQC